MRVSPLTPPMTIATSSTKQYDHSSPGSIERMIGWPADAAWRLAWRFGELSQQPTRPHSRQMRRCTQVPPVARHSAHPSTASGSSVILIVSRWVHRAMTVVSGSVLAEGEPHREGGAAGGGVDGQGAVVPDDDAARRGQ